MTARRDKVGGKDCQGRRNVWSGGLEERRTKRRDMENAEKSEIPKEKKNQGKKI